MNIDITKAVNDAEQLLQSDQSLSPAMKASFNILLLVVKLLSNRLDLNSANSSKPPASGPNREKKPRSKSTKSPGGQNGHSGSNLQALDDPDEVKFIKLDRRTLLYVQLNNWPYYSYSPPDP